MWSFLLTNLVALFELIVWKLCCIYSFIMVACQLAGRQPLYFTEVCFYPLFSLPNLRGLWSLDRSPPNFATCSVVNVIYKIGHWVRNLESLHPKIWWPKNIKILAQFRTTSRLDSEYLWNGTRYSRSENGLQTVVTPVHAYKIWWTFGPQTEKIRPEFWPTENQLFRTFISQGLRGVAPKNFTVCRGWLTLANAYLLGDGSAPNNF